LRGRIRAQWCHQGQARSKNTGKTVESVVQNGGKWRFFDDLERHFAVRRADSAPLQHARLKDLTFRALGCLERRLARRINRGAPFFAGRGTKLHM
jgi:hypothetical protein